MNAGARLSYGLQSTTSKRGTWGAYVSASSRNNHVHYEHSSGELLGLSAAGREDGAHMLDILSRRVRKVEVTA